MTRTEMTVADITPADIGSILEFGNGGLAELRKIVGYKFHSSTTYFLFEGSTAGGLFSNQIALASDTPIAIWK